MRNEAALSKKYDFDIIIFLYFDTVYMYISYRLHSNCIWCIVTYMIILLLHVIFKISTCLQNFNMSSKLQHVFKTSTFLEKFNMSSKLLMQYGDLCPNFRTYSREFKKRNDRAADSRAGKEDTRSWSEQIRI